MTAAYQNIPRLYSAIAECCACFIYVFLLKKRYTSKKLVIYSILFFALQSTLLVTTKNISNTYWLPVMAVAVLNMWIYLKLCCKGTGTFIGYTTAAAFLQAELAASLEWQLHCYLFFYKQLPQYFALLLFAVVYAFAFAAFYFFEKLILKDIEADISIKEFLLAVCIVLFSFAFSNLSFLNTSLPFTSQSTKDIFNIRTLVDGMGLGILYAYQNRIEEMHLKNELIFIQTLLDTQYQNFLNYEESIELIHIKYHDLKHQIAALRVEEDPHRREQWISSMETELELYDVNFNTGNKVLDTILSNKQLLCKKHQIHCTYIVDGSAIRFISESDICSIFGNILDNAMEAARKIPDKEKRLIHLQVSEKRQFLCIQCENYYTDAIKMESGLPQTTKTNKTNHGFGIKSIRYTVKKYDGNVIIDAKNNWFKITILIPTKKQDTAIGTDYIYSKYVPRS